METRFLDTDEATNKFWAYKDAKQNSYANSTHYTAAERCNAERKALALETVYAAKHVYVSYKKRWISLKVDGAVVRNKKDLTFLEEGWTLENIVKRVTAQGVTYRIPKRG